MGCEALSWLCSSLAPLPNPSCWKPSAAWKRRPYCCCASDSPAPRKKPNHQPEDFVRRWIEADAAAAALSTSHSQSRVVVVSYNILGDDNASNHHDLYSHIPSHFMKWDRRQRLICQEFRGWNADIVCLQRRTGEAMDGCAMLWKKNLVHLLEGESIEFKRFGLRDNVAQLFVFEVIQMHESSFTCKPSYVYSVYEDPNRPFSLTQRQMRKDDSRRLLVGNIHVLFNPNRGDIKLGQIRLLLQKAHALSKKWGDIPVVLAGDFNSTPKSAIYKFLSSSELNITMLDRRYLSGQNRCQPAQFLGMPRMIRKPFILKDRFVKYSWTDEELITATGNSKCTKLEHPLTLCSSYATLKGNAMTRDIRGEPLATTYHSKFLGAVDYLWYSDGLAPTKVLDTLPIGILQRTGGLPSKKFGSDHLALVSEFVFVQSRRDEEQHTTTETAPATARGLSVTTTAKEEEEVGGGEEEEEKSGL